MTKYLLPLLVLVGGIFWSFFVEFSFPEIVGIWVFLIPLGVFSYLISKTLDEQKLKFALLVGKKIKLKNILKV